MRSRVAGWRASLASEKGTSACAFLFFLFFAWSSIDFNGKVPLDDWRSDLRADAAGYYIYLPGLFHHGMRAATVSDSLVVLGGYGFQADHEHDRIVTKYTCGTALLQLPFFLLAESIEGFGATDGWTRTHHQAIEAAGIFYWTSGLLLIALALRRWRPTANGVALLVLACIAFGTNTFYFAFRSPGYSHVYSFFLVSLALHSIYADRGSPMRRSSLWGFAFAIAMIVLIRPIDVLAVLALVFLMFRERPYLVRSFRFHATQLAVGMMVALPQMIYWRFAHGSWVVYSYGDEGFGNWASPYLAEVLFAPENGLLPHAPAFLLLPFALVVLFKQERANAWLLLVLLSLAVYSCAAWHIWTFGCSYGMRPLVQYTPFLAMGLWSLFDRWCSLVPSVRLVAVSLLALLCFVNYRAMLQYDVCYSSGSWDWGPWARNIFEAFFGKAAW